MISLKGARSGPAISTMPFRGAASATSATLAATSSAAMGWNRTGGSLTMFPSLLESAMPPRNSTASPSAARRRSAVPSARRPGAPSARGGSFDDLVGEHQDRVRDCQPERLGSVQIDDQLE